MVYNMYALVRIRYNGLHLTSPLEDMRKMIDRPIKKLRQKLSYQKIHQFLGVISNPKRYCFKKWKAKRSKLRADPKQARGEGSINAIPFQDFDPDNKTRLLMLPGK